MCQILRLCYLCGEPIEDKSNEDHVFQQQFLKRKQPKAKGFYYAGVLKTHEKCNKLFGGKSAGAEAFSKKALELLHVLHDEDCILTRERKDAPSIKIMLISSECLSSFTEEELRFFGMIDVRDKEYQEWTSKEFILRHEKINPFKKPMNTALSVLAKSAAALLVSGFGFWPNPIWRIMAVPHYSESADVDFDRFFGQTKPLEIGIKVWAKRWQNRDWFVAYKYEGLIVFFSFGGSLDNTNFDNVAHVFHDASKLMFESKKLIDLINHNWVESKYSR